MVRRWSRINLLNKRFKTDFKNWMGVHNVLNVRATRRFRPYYTPFSFNFRKQRARLNHYSGFIFYTSLFVRWASDYRFCKQKNNFIFNNFFFKKNYITSNFNFLDNNMLVKLYSSRYFSPSFLTRKNSKNKKLLSKTFLTTYKSINSIKLDPFFIFSPWLLVSPKNQLILFSAENDYNLTINKITFFLSYQIITTLKIFYKIFINLLVLRNSK